MTKKAIRNFGGRKSEILSGKGKIQEIFHRVLKFFENRGKSETEGKCIIVSGGMDAPDGVTTKGSRQKVQRQHVHGQKVHDIRFMTKGSRKKVHDKISRQMVHDE